MKDLTSSQKTSTATFRTLAVFTNTMLLAMVSGCSSAGSDLPSNEIGGPEVAGNASTQVLEDEASQNLVAQISLKGRVIKFFEPEEGTLLEVEKAFEGVTWDPSEQGLSGSALYAHLTGAEAPAALLDAEWRVQALSEGRDASERLRQPSELDSDVSGQETPDRTLPGVRPATSWTESKETTEEYFVNKYCARTDRFYGCGSDIGSRCFNNSSIQKSNVNMMQAGARSYSNTNVYAGSYDSFGGAVIYDATLEETEVFGWRRTSTTQGTARSAVAVGQDASFQHCVNYHF